MGAKVIEVIVTELLIRGKGIEGDPMRRILQYWTLDGELLAEVDPCNSEHSFFNPFIECYYTGSVE